jgi:hypothetical protein
MKRGEERRGEERRGEERKIVKDTVFYRRNVRLCCGKARLERRQSDEETREMRTGRFLDCEQTKKIVLGPCCFLQ